MTLSLRARFHLISQMFPDCCVWVFPKQNYFINHTQCNLWCILWHPSCLDTKKWRHISLVASQTASNSHVCSIASSCWGITSILMRKAFLCHVGIVGCDGNRRAAESFIDISRNICFAWHVCFCICYWIHMMHSPISFSHINWFSWFTRFYP